MDRARATRNSCCVDAWRAGAQRTSCWGWSDDAVSFVAAVVGLPTGSRYTSVLPLAFAFGCAVAFVRTCVCGKGGRHSSIVCGRASSPTLGKRWSAGALGRRGGVIVTLVLRVYESATNTGTSISPRCEPLSAVQTWQPAALEPTWPSCTSRPPSVLEYEIMTSFAPQVVSGWPIYFEGQTTNGTRCTRVRTRVRTFTYHGMYSYEQATNQSHACPRR
jgi:hypothetical protein